jgi:hypothetical protein
MGDQRWESASWLTKFCTGSPWADCSRGSSGAIRGAPVDLWVTGDGCNPQYGCNWATFSSAGGVRKLRKSRAALSSTAGAAANGGHRGDRAEATGDARDPAKYLVGRVRPALRGLFTHNSTGDPERGAATAASTRSVTPMARSSAAITVRSASDRTTRATFRRALEGATSSASSAAGVPGAFGHDGATARAGVLSAGRPPYHPPSMGSA